MIEILGWVCTVLILIGYFLNSSHKLKQAIAVWVVGDIGWVYYDLCIQNWSHMSLSFLIIGLNLYGVYNIIKKNNGRKEND